MLELIRKLTSAQWQWEQKDMFLEGEQCLSEQQVFCYIQNTRKKLTEATVRQGDRVLLMIPAGVTLYVTLYALWSLEATAVIFDTMMQPDSMKSCMERGRVTKVICQKQMKSRIMMLMGENVEVLCSEELTGNFTETGNTIPEGSIHLSPDREALISFTSGSTGNPKGIVRTFGFLEKQREEIRKRFCYEPQDVDFAVMPIFTAMNLVFGIKTILPCYSLKDKTCGSFIIKDMIRHNVTRVILSPFLAECLLKAASDAKVILSGVRKVFVGGGPVHKHLIIGITKLFPNAECFLLYGCSEAEPIALFPMKELGKEQWKSIECGEGLVAGHPCLPVAIIKNELDRKIGKITSQEFDALKLEDGVGEIVVTGEHVLKGYLDGIGDAENKIAVGDIIWHRTGDLGKIKEDGLLYLYGRTKAAVHTKAGFLYPFCVESKVYADFQVEEAALVMKNQEKILVVQVKEEEEYIRLENSKEGLKVDKVVRIEKMPKDKKHLSKVDYGELKKKL